MLYSVFVTDEENVIDAYTDPTKNMVVFHNVEESEKDVLVNLCIRSNYGILLSPYGGNAEDDV